MGTRSASHTALVLLAKLLETRTWRQAELATEVGLTSETVRKHLLQLMSEDVPLQREEEDGQVYWSVPREWGPQGAFIGQEDLYALLALIARHPRSEERDRLIDRIVRVLPSPAVWRRKLELITAGDDAVDGTILDALVESAAAREALEIRYHSVSQGQVDWRWVSPQRVVPPHRMVAWCHRRDELRWFRIDRVIDVRPPVVGADAARVAFREVDPAEVEQLVRGSIGGFQGDEPELEHVFVVRPKEARWVRHNLPFGDAATADVTSDGSLRVAVRTRAMAHVARYVVGLGDAVTVATPELAAAVEQLAAGALAALLASGSRTSSGTDVQRRPTGGPDAGPPHSVVSPHAAKVAAMSDDATSRQEEST